MATAVWIPKSQPRPKNQISAVCARKSTKPARRLSFWKKPAIRVATGPKKIDIVSRAAAIGADTLIL